MRLPLEFHAQARLELREAAEYLEAHRAGLGASFLDEVSRGLELITAFHRAARRVDASDGPELRRIVMRRFSFIIVYVVKPDRLVVVAVAHTSRLPGYWADRV